MLEVATSLVDELATLHAAYQGHELRWLRTPSGMRRKPEDAETASRRAITARYVAAPDKPLRSRKTGSFDLIHR
jgi:hypothetical protein